MSKTGNKAGFTLIEVMAATAVLAGGVVLIFEALFSTTNTFSYYASRMSLGPWIDQKVWELKEAVIANTPVETAGTLTRGAREFSWKASQTSDAETGLTRIGLEVSWPQGKRQARLERGMYVFVPMEKEEEEEG